MVNHFTKKDRLSRTLIKKNVFLKKILVQVWIVQNRIISRLMGSLDLKTANRGRSGLTNEALYIFTAQEATKLLSIKFVGHK